MTKTLIEADHVQNRLADLGLNADRLTDIVRRGYVAFASSSPNDPPLYAGFSAWAMMVRGLREYLLPEWERSDENNYSLVINPSGDVAIAVATGDEATGLTTGSPSTKSAKGPSTAEAVASNQLQLNFPHVSPAASGPSRPVKGEEQRMTWILLVHRALDEVRCELSLPTSMGDDGRVHGWRERIILGAIPTDPAVLEVTPAQPPLPDITVDVKRRT